MKGADKMKGKRQLFALLLIPKKIFFLFNHPGKVIKAFRTLRSMGFRVFITKVMLFNDLIETDSLLKLWISENAYDKEKLKKDQEEVRKLKLKPKISIILPTYNTPEKFLRKCLDSVLNQIYPNWELCIADDASTKQNVKKIIQEYAKKDQRIKYIFRTNNGNISKASNSAISIATGQFIALLDHDDILLRNALLEVVKSINLNKNAKFIYTDYAIMTAEGKIHRLEFCPDFSRIYYLSHPYLVHLVVIERKMFNRVQGWDEKNFNAGISHDVDLSLRLFAIIEDKDIIHIPVVLYLWRQYQQSTGFQQQSRVAHYTKFGLVRYLKLKKIDGIVEDGEVFNTFRIRPKIKQQPLVSIIIPTKDCYQLLAKCLDSIEKKGGYKRYEVIIVKNNTTDKKAIDYLKSIRKKHTVIDYQGSFNFSKINNFAAKYAKGEFLLLLNDDIEFKKNGFLKSMLELFELNEVGVVGAKLLYPNNTIQHFGVIVGLRGPAEHWHKFLGAYLDKEKKIPDPGYISSLVSIREYSAVTAACLMTRRNLFQQIGGLPEELKVGLNDVDYCLKVIKAGYKVLCTPYALAYHHEHASRAEAGNKSLIKHPKDNEIFLRSWKEFLKAGDPYYNPNLSLDSYIPIPRV